MNIADRAQWENAVARQVRFVRKKLDRVSPYRHTDEEIRDTVIHARKCWPTTPTVVLVATANLLPTRSWAAMRREYS